MRFSAGLLLATATIAHVAASPVHQHQHARLHRKAADLHLDEPVEKRDPGLEDVDWSTVAITYSAGQTWGRSTPAAAQPVVASSASAAAATAATVPKVVAAGVSAAGTKTITEVTSVVSNVLAAADSTKILALGLKSAGINAVSRAGGVWIGTDGDYTNEITNASGQDLVIVAWGPWSSWVNANTPLITLSIPAGGKTTLSYVSGSIGAMSAIYSDTTLVNGQLAETWIEYTLSPEGVVNISREPRMNGHAMQVVGPQCTTNMSQCVFVCNSGNSCETDYELLNCTPGSQAGAQYGLFDGAPSGGCGGLGSSAALKTTLM